MSGLDNVRKIIDETDREMARLFERRMDAAKLVAEYKKEHGLPIDDFPREEAILARNAEYVANPEYRADYINFLRNNIELSKKLQHRMLDGMRVAYSGVEGAFADIVARRIFPDAQTVPTANFQSAYEAVVNGECDCALLPIENSQNGDVGQVMDLAFFGSLYINGVYEAEIVQNLLAVKGTELSDIKQVISHPQALGQCSKYIRKHGFEPVEAVNTAVAAKQVADSGSHTLAAIGSSEAAEKFGLVKLETHINDKSGNTTRFAVFTRVPREQTPSDKRFIMLFTVNNAAGSLGRAVSVIGEHGFNLIALKSRPTKELIWDYYFYVEGEGNINSEQGQQMLSDLEACCSTVKIIGSFERDITV